MTLTVSEATAREALRIAVRTAEPAGTVMGFQIRVSPFVPKDVVVLEHEGNIQVIRLSGRT